MLTPSSPKNLPSISHTNLSYNYLSYSYLLNPNSRYLIFTAYYQKYINEENDFVEDYEQVSNDINFVFESAGWYWNQGKVLSINNTMIWNPNIDSPNYIKVYKPSFRKNKITYNYKNIESGSYGTINLNDVADKDYGDLISYFVNGGANGINERRKYVRKLKELFDYENCISNI